MTARPRKTTVPAVTKPDFDALLSGARLPEGSYGLCLRGDLQADFEAAEAELEAAQKRPATGKEDGGVAHIVERIERIQAEMRANTYPVRVRGLPRPRFRLLMTAFPPRRDDSGDPDPGDAQLGFDRSTFFEALLKVSTIDPDMGIDVEAYFRELEAGNMPELPAGKWSELLPKLTDRQWGDLTDAAWFANRNEVSVPFSLAASRAKRPSVDE